MPHHSRVWVYQSKVELTPQQVEHISENTFQFLESWAAHGAALMAAFEIRLNRFLVLAVDEQTAGASGCSIDKMVRHFQAIDDQFQLGLFDRMQVCYRKGTSIETVHLNTFAELLAAGELSNETIVFNNLVETKAELDNKWETIVEQSWHANLLA